MKQLNLVILVPVLRLGDRYSGLIQKILARYGFARQPGNFPALIFRYYPGVLDETAPGENPPGPEVMERAGGRFDIYHYINNGSGRTNQPLYTGNAAPGRVLNSGTAEVIKRVAEGLNIYHYINNGAGRADQPLYTGNAVPGRVLNSGTAEVIKRVAEGLNIYHYITNGAGRADQPLYTGNAAPGRVLNSGPAEIIKRVAERLNIYNYITNRAGRANQPLYAGSTEQYAPDIYNHYSDNRKNRTDQAFHVHNAEYAPILFNTENAWMTYVQKKHLTYVMQYVPRHNVFHVVTRQENSAGASPLLRSIPALARENPEWREQSVQVHNNPIGAPVSGRISVSDVPEYLPLQEKTAPGKSPLPGIQLACALHNIRNIHWNTLFNTSPGASLNHLDMKPVRQETIEKQQADPNRQVFTVPQQRTEFVKGADTGRAGSVTERKYIEQKAHLLKRTAKIQPVVLTINNRTDNLQEFFITRDNVWAKIREEQSPGTSSPGANAEEERVTVNRREIIGQDRLIFDKRTIEEAYDVQEAQLSKQLPVQGKEAGFAAPGIQVQTQDVSNLVTGSPGKGRMDSNRLWAMVTARHNLTVKNNVAAMADHRAIREFKPDLIERAEDQGGKTIPGYGVKQHFNNEAGVETHRSAKANQGETGELPWYGRAVRQGRLIFRKPNPIPREGAAGAEPVFKEAPPGEKKGDNRMVTAQKQVQSINDIDVEEINLLAERVFKVLEKRISIQKDRRGLL